MPGRGGSYPHPVRKGRTGQDAAVRTAQVRGTIGGVDTPLTPLLLLLLSCISRVQLCATP